MGEQMVEFTLKELFGSMWTFFKAQVDMIKLTDELFTNIPDPMNPRKVYETPEAAAKGMMLNVMEMIKKLREGE